MGSCRDPGSARRPRREPSCAPWRPLWAGGPRCRSRRRRRRPRGACGREVLAESSDDPNRYSPDGSHDRGIDICTPSEPMDVLPSGCTTSSTVRLPTTTTRGSDRSTFAGFSRSSFCCHDHHLSTSWTPRSRRLFDQAPAHSTGAPSRCSRPVFIALISSSLTISLKSWTAQSQECRVRNLSPRYLMRWLSERGNL